MMSLFKKNQEIVVKTITSTPFRSATLRPPTAPKKPSFFSKFNFSTTPTERKVMAVIFVFIATIALWFGISSLLAYILMLLVNYVTPTIHHPEIHLTFWPAFAIMVICSLLFKSSSGSSSK